jgi:light-regulated signal transduction histidine kinase (bacteriophytochrome)
MSNPTRAELIKQNIELKQKLAEAEKASGTIARDDVNTPSGRAPSAEQARTNHPEELLKQRTADLQALNEELDAFISSVSHDLSAPLRVVEGYTRSLAEDYTERLGPEARESLAIVRRACGTMGQMIEGMLKLSRLMRTEMDIDAVNLSEVAEDVIQELNNDQPERKIEWVIAPDISARADLQLVQIILRNLFENAYKFTRQNPDPKIEFDMRRWDDKKVYFVRDNGIGFDMQYADKLFQPFQRLHSAEQYAGLGVGLATVKRAVRRHGGTVWAESASGRGATFYFTLG